MKEWITKFFFMFIGGIFVPWQVTAAENIKVTSELLDFVHARLSFGEVAPYLGCNIVTQLSVEKRNFSSGERSTKTLFVQLKSPSYYGETDWVVAFNLGCDAEREILDSPEGGVVERLTFFSDDPYYHFFVFEHDGLGAIVKAKIGNSLGESICSGKQEHLTEPLGLGGILN